MSKTARRKASLKAKHRRVRARKTGKMIKLKAGGRLHVVKRKG